MVGPLVSRNWGGAAMTPYQTNSKKRVSNDALFLSQRDYVIQPKVVRAAGSLGNNVKRFSTLKELQRCE